MKRKFFWFGALLTAVSTAFAQDRSPSPTPADFDVIIKDGTVYDGTGAEAKQADVAIRGDRIVGIGDFKAAKAKTMINAKGLAVAPGFINMLSWSTVSLIQDGRSQSEIRQGVTTEIMGEGESMGPVNDRVREHMVRQQIDVKYDIKWNTLAEYLQYLERRGVSCNVASFIGATTIREYVIGFEDKQPTPEQLDQMRELVRKEMEAGALGIGTSLIYPPAFYAKTEELVELCKVAAKYQGKYISHMRSEGNRLLEALDELIRISREAKIPAEVYHIKASGHQNWPKIEDLLSRIEAAQKEGLKISADMYTYTAGGTGLDASLPPWTDRRSGPGGHAWRIVFRPQRRWCARAPNAGTGNGWPIRFSRHGRASAKRHAPRWVTAAGRGHGRRRSEGMTDGRAMVGCHETPSLQVAWVNRSP